VQGPAGRSPFYIPQRWPRRRAGDAQQAAHGDAPAHTVVALQEQRRSVPARRIDATVIAARRAVLGCADRRS